LETEQLLVDRQSTLQAAPLSVSHSSSVSERSAGSNRVGRPPTRAQFVERLAIAAESADRPIPTVAAQAMVDDWPLDSLEPVKAAVARPTLGQTDDQTTDQAIDSTRDAYRPELRGLDAALLAAAADQTAERRDVVVENPPAAADQPLGGSESSHDVATTPASAHHLAAYDAGVPLTTRGRAGFEIVDAVFDEEFFEESLPRNWPFH